MGDWVQPGPDHGQRVLAASALASKVYGESSEEEQKEGGCESQRVMERHGGRACLACRCSCRVGRQCTSGR